MLGILVLLVAGFLIGSFLNVCIHRIPRGGSVVVPSSRCPRCGHRLGAADLVPVLSWLLLRGRCRYCGGAVSLRYPLVELLTGFAFALVFLKTGFNLMLLKYLVLTSLLITASFIDLEHYIIPNQLIVFGLGSGLLLSPFTQPGIVSSLIGALLTGGVLLLLAVASRGGMGGGDIKLAAVVGLYLGWSQGLLALFLAAVMAGAAGLVLMVLRIKGRKDYIAFGPGIAAGAFVTILWGESIVQWYLASFW
ncbi:MAG: prepilin peptidase [Peptococcaceae bacterium]|nr:prepilin peptidase [Peptococcaceae bacterium]